MREEYGKARGSCGGPRCGVRLRPAARRGAPLNRGVAGWITLAIGVALIALSYLQRASVPRWLPRVAIATTGLGLGTLAARQPGIGWSIVSSAYSLIAIVLLISVIVDMVRGGRPDA
jgi:hypothetical protein